MDYDNNNAHDENLNLTDEASPKVSPVSHSYALPKFEFDDSLQEHLRFDNLVENEVFLGITSQVDNEWIEDYSRGTRAAESRHKNVWSEATSSESVEMLLNSVGQDDKVVEETIVEELDAGCDKTSNLTNSMDTDINTLNPIVQDESLENLVGSKLSDDVEQSHETQVSVVELDSVVIGEKEVDTICDDANQERDNLVIESFVNEVVPDESQENIVGSKVSDDFEHPQETQVSNVELDSVVISEKKDDEVCDDVNQERDILVNESFVNAVEPDESQENLVGSKVSGDFEQSHETQVSGGELNSVMIGEKKVEEVCDDVNLEGGNLVNESLVNELEQDPSASKAECGNESIEEHKEESQEAFETLIENEISEHVETQEIEDDNTKSEIQEFSKPNEHSDYVEEKENVEESDINNDVETLVVTSSPSEVPTEDVSNDVSDIQTGDLNDEDRSSPAKLSDSVQVNDENQSLEHDDVSMDQDVAFDEVRDANLSLDVKDMDVDVVEAPEIEKNVEPILSNEGCEKVTANVQEPESNMAVLTDTVEAVESSKLLSPDTPEVVQLPSETVEDVQLPSVTVSTADIITEEQPRSPILGVSLLPDNNGEKTEVDISNEENSQKSTPEVDSTVDCGLDSQLPEAEKDEVSDSVEEAVQGQDGHFDPPVENCNATSSEQTTVETNLLPSDTSAEGVENKELTTEEDTAEPINIAVNKLDEQPASVDEPVSSEHDTNQELQNEDVSASLEKPQDFSFSDAKSIELSQTEKDKHEVTEASVTNESSPLSKMSNDEKGHQSVPSSSPTNKEKSFTFEINLTPTPAQTTIQNVSSSKNIKAIPVSISGDKSPEVSMASPQTPTSALVTETVTKVTTERKPRRKSAARETAKKTNPSKETTTPAKHSGRVEKSPATHPHGTPREDSKPNDPINPAVIFHQSFTDQQQLQLRAQILVYGSLISKIPPEEPHMIAAFGQYDGGRRAWEATWQACVERVRAPQSQPNNNPSTPIQLRPGNKEFDQGVKSNSTQTKILSTPISTPIVNSMIPLSSPLWNLSTPVAASQSSIPRNPFMDYRQTITSLHPYPGPYPGQWVASSPVSTFNSRYSSLPITEAVKLTTVKESGGSGTPVAPVDHTGSIASPLLTSVPNLKKSTVSSGQGQPVTESKSRKRKKVAVSQPQVALPSVSPVVNNQISFLPQIPQMQTPVTGQSKANPVSFLSAVTPVSTLGQTRIVDQTVEKTVMREEMVSKIEESKVQAADAAVHAATAVNHCEGVWSQMKKQKSNSLVSEDEAKLASSAVSIAAAASVAKVAAAAAKIAANVAEQARLMADEVLNANQSNELSASVGRSVEHSSSIISVAREAARRRIQAASAASKHAENLDAILKAAELAAEAVSQAGKIVAMGNPLPLNELIKSGPEGYWKTPQSDKQIVEGEIVVIDKEVRSLKDGQTSDLTKNQMMIVDGNDKVTVNAIQGPEMELESVHTSKTWKETGIKEGCLVEVFKDNKQKKGGWFAANVLNLKDGQAFVCYNEIESDEEGKLKEWVPLEAEGSDAPKIRVAHPMTTLRFEGNKKRGRRALAEYDWCSGDRVDVWVHDRWREAVVVDTNKIDVTSLTVQFSGQGETSIVRSWHVRPTLIWNDGKWIEWSSLKGSRSSEGNPRQEKRQKFGSPIVEIKEKDDKSSNNINIVESNTLPLTVQTSSFDIGKTSTDDNKVKPRKTVKNGLPKERSGVVFGVPKPGKRQKFMEVSKHYVANGGNNKNNNNTTSNDSVKPASHSIPQAPGQRGLKNISRNDVKDKQVVEVKSKLVKPRKPPIPSTLVHKEKPKSSKPASHDGYNSDKTVDEKESSTSKSVSQRLNKRKFTPGDGKSAKVEVKEKEKSTSEAEPRRSNRKIQPTSRLLEGLQSSLTISKIPTFSHANQKSNKGTPKGASSNNSG